MRGNEGVRVNDREKERLKDRTQGPKKSGRLKKGRGDWGIEGKSKTQRG